MRVIASLISASVLLLFSLVSPAFSQGTVLAEHDCQPSDDLGVVHGRVVKANQPLRRFVELTGPFTCWARTDSAGLFRFQYVPTGDYTISTRDGSSQIFEPLPISVRADTTEVTLELRPYDVIADCLALSGCDRYLRPGERVLPAGVDPLVEAGLRTGIGVAIARRYGSFGSIPCIRDVTAELLDVLRRVAPTAVDSEECGLKGDFDPNQRLYHLPSGQRAFSVSFRVIERNETTALGGLGASFGRLAGVGWECSYVREDDTWELEKCRVVARA